MRARRIDERGDNWEGRCPQRPRASRLILRAVSGEKLVSRITSRTFLCVGRGVLLRPSQLFLALCIVAYSFAHSLMQRTAPEGRGPPSYFSLICRTRIIHLYVANLKPADIISPYETRALFPNLGKGIPHTSRNASACGDTHIGHE